MDHQEVQEIKPGNRRNTITMKTIHKVGIAAATVAVVLAIKAAERAKQLAAIFEKMTIKPYGLPRDVDLVGLKELRFTTDIILTNPTVEDFSVSGYVAVLDKVIVEYRGEFLGSAKVEIEEISVPAKDTLILHDIRIVIATGVLLDNLVDLYDMLKSGGGDWKDVTLKGLIDAPGGPYEIG